MVRFIALPAACHLLVRRLTHQDCTYDKPSNRRRNPILRYLETLEDRMQLAEMMLRKFVPAVNLNDPNLEPAVQQEFRKRTQARARTARTSSNNAHTLRASLASISSSQNTGPAHNNTGTITLGNDGNGGDADNDKGNEQGGVGLFLDSMGQLDLDDGGWGFHGTSSSAVFMARMMELFNGENGQLPILPLPQTHPSALRIGGSTQSSPPRDLAAPSSPSNHELPSKTLVLSRCSFALGYGPVNARILHQPSFYQSRDQTWDVSAEDHSKDDLRFIALIYAVVTLGCVYHSLDKDAPATWRSANEEGY